METNFVKLDVSINDARHSAKLCQSLTPTETRVGESDSGQLDHRLNSTDRRNLRLETRTRGRYLMTRLFLLSTLKCGDERLSNFLPIRASFTFPGLRTYSMAKSTISRCSKSINADYSEQDLTVT